MGAFSRDREMWRSPHPEALRFVAKETNGIRKWEQFLNLKNVTDPCGQYVSRIYDETGCARPKDKRRKSEKQISIMRTSFSTIKAKLEEMCIRDSDYAYLILYDQGETGGGNRGGGWFEF
ncbi:hypothetical protein DBV15_08912 [Temnothorax longispinosus]|uniref:Uncharacterized protein n=1 Tax=Temnothorax longispinosus TaxID=300112 RepID=A0A4S2KAV9_9HYME|nr:hypothetical protein DBV15_08912 [Temnothorax longispinosus]